MIQAAVSCPRLWARPPHMLISKNENLVVLKIISIIRKLNSPPDNDIINAVVPLVRRTKKDLSRTIEKLMPMLSSDIEIITGRFEKPGFTPSGRGISISTEEIAMDNASKIPEKAVF